VSFRESVIVRVSSVFVHVSVPRPASKMSGAPSAGTIDRARLAYRDRFGWNMKG
jgi:hypothetical protein